MLRIVNNKRLISPDKYIETIEPIYETAIDSVSTHPLLPYILREVDGSEYIGDKMIKTKFGLTTLSNISSGCKTLFVALIFPDYWIDFLDAGANVFRYAVRISKDYELKIVTHGKTLDSRDDIMVELNGIQISAKDIRKVSRNKQFGTVVPQ